MPEIFDVLRSVYIVAPPLSVSPTPASKWFLCMRIEEFKKIIHETRLPEMRRVQTVDNGSTTIVPDVHGGLGELLKILYGNRLIDENGNWIGGNKALTILGDMIDRGPYGWETYMYLTALQKQAEELGGTVELLAGNHELKVCRGDYRLFGEWNPNSNTITRYPNPDLFREILINHIKCGVVKLMTDGGSLNYVCVHAAYERYNQLVFLHAKLEEKKGKPGSNYLQEDELLLSRVKSELEARRLWRAACNDGLYTIIDLNPQTDYTNLPKMEAPAKISQQEINKWMRDNNYTLQDVTRFTNSILRRMVEVPLRFAPRAFYGEPYIDIALQLLTCSRYQFLRRDEREAELKGDKVIVFTGHNMVNSVNMSGGEGPRGPQRVGHIVWNDTFICGTRMGGALSFSSIDRNGQATGYYFKDGDWLKSYEIRIPPTPEVRVPMPSLVMT